MAIHPTLPIAYVLSEMTSELTTFPTDEHGVPCGPALTVPFSTLPEDSPSWGGAAMGSESASTCAALRIHASGHFLYCSNRVVGQEGIVTSFQLDPGTGVPSLESRVCTPTGGEVPREINLVCQDTVLLVANQNSSTITAFAVDQASGGLARMGEPQACPTPVCLLEVSG